MKQELMEKVANFLKCRLDRELVEMYGYAGQEPELELTILKIQGILKVFLRTEDTELFIDKAVEYLSQFEEM